MQQVSAEPVRPMIIARSWLQVAILTFAVGFGILAYLAYSIYNEHAPIPDRFVGPGNGTVITRADILAGQQLFATRGLMEQGTIFGHGAYLGPDFTADALHRMEQVMGRHYGVPAGTVRKYTLSSKPLLRMNFQARKTVFLHCNFQDHCHISFSA